MDNDRIIFAFRTLYNEFGKNAVFTDSSYIDKGVREMVNGNDFADVELLKNAINSGVGQYYIPMIEGRIQHNNDFYYSVLQMLLNNGFSQETAIHVIRLFDDVIGLNSNPWNNSNGYNDAYHSDENHYAINKYPNDEPQHLDSSYFNQVNVQQQHSVPITTKKKSATITATSVLSILLIGAILAFIRHARESERILETTAFSFDDFTVETAKLNPNGKTEINSYLSLEDFYNQNDVKKQVNDQLQLQNQNQDFKSITFEADGNNLIYSYYYSQTFTDEQIVQVKQYILSQEEKIRETALTLKDNLDATLGIRPNSIKYVYYNGDDKEIIYLLF